MTNPTQSHPDLPLDDETLAAFVDGRLEAPRHDAVEAAMLADADVRRAVADLVAIRDAFAAGALGGVTSPGLAQRVQAALERAQAPGRPSMSRSSTPSTKALAPRVFRMVPLAVAAALLLGLGILALTVDSGTYRRGPTFGEAPGERGGALHEAARAPQRDVAVVVPDRDPPLTGDRYLAHLSVDKPIYRPGEKVYARAIVLEAFRRVPAVGQGAAVFQLKSPKGETVLRQQTDVPGGAAAFGWQIPTDIAGGTFTLIAHVNHCPPTEITFDVRDFRAPRIKTDLEFVKKAYGPGDLVEATLTAERAEGGIPAGARVTAIARVDGTEVARSQLTLDATGSCRVRFRLPTEIQDGEGTLALIVEDGGVTETAAQTIPIVLSRVRLRFLPEGGELVAGLSCGVYFDAQTSSQEPADVRGRILDDEGVVVARFASVHEGRGRVEFSPHAARTYHAVVDAPAGIDEAVALPLVVRGGFSLRARADAFGADQPIQVALASTSDTTASVGLFVRERELTRTTVRLRAGEPVQVTLPVHDDLAGVLRVTVFDRAGAPRAERLVFRQPVHAARVELRPDTERTIPGAPVRVRVRTLDERGRPIRALVALSATDDAVLTQPQRRKRAARLGAQALLGCEVEALMDPGAYLTRDALGFRNIDLLLGTQGWRRFAFVEAREESIKLLGDPGRRAFAWTERPEPEVLTQVLRFNFSTPVGPDKVIITDSLRDAAQVGALLRFQPRFGREGMRRGAVIRDGAAMGGVGVLGAGDGGDARPLDDAVRRRAGAAEGRRKAKPAGRLEGKPNAKPADARVLDEDLDVLKEADAGVARPPVGLALRKFRAPAAAAKHPVPLQIGDELLPKWSLYRLQAVAGVFQGWHGQVAPPVPAWSRLYAHQAPKDRPARQRADFTETVYWNPGTWTDSNGELTVAFDTSDSITTVRVRADVVTATGGLGQADATIEVRRPLFVEPKFPLEVTAGDRIDLPLAITNGTHSEMTVRLELLALKGFRQAAGEIEGLTIPIEGSARVILPLIVESFQGTGEITVKVTGGGHTDIIRRRLRVVARGFPIEQNAGGLLERRVTHTFTIPADVDPSSIVTAGAVYPTPLASLQEALRGLLREPGGCFEQTSSTNYPNVMAMQYLNSHEGADPALLTKAAGMLRRGYARLVSFECKEKGYEWFGGDPGHEALTAYGVLQFRDMAQVMDVDADMVLRTRQWLLARRDGKGGFKRNARALDRFGGAPDATTDAYILWALLEAGETGLQADVLALGQRLRKSKDSYVLALGANIFALDGKSDTARLLMDRLAKAQVADGSVGGATTSITRSGGDALKIETTSLAVLAWLRSPAHTKHVEAAMQWLVSRCKGGRFGSTQSTVLALKAIVAYDASRATARKPGRLIVRLDGASLFEMAFDADATGPFQIPDLSESFTPGEHTLELEMLGGVDMPYAFTLRYNAATPNSAKRASVSIETSISAERVSEGEPVDIPVTVRNTTKAGIPMATAIVGLPGGVEVRAEQLKELMKQGLVDFVELRGREVVLYWRAMAPEAVYTLRLSGVAAVPGTYEAPASRTYLYYTDEDKVWTEGLRIQIDAR